MVYKDTLFHIILISLGPTKKRQLERIGQIERPASYTPVFIVLTSSIRYRFRMRGITILSSRSSKASTASGLEYKALHHSQ